MRFGAFVGFIYGLEMLCFDAGLKHSWSLLQVFVKDFVICLGFSDCFHYFSVGRQ